MNPQSVSGEPSLDDRYRAVRHVLPVVAQVAVDSGVPVDAHEEVEQFRPDSVGGSRRRPRREETVRELDAQCLTYNRGSSRSAHSSSARDHIEQLDSRGAPDETAASSAAVPSLESMKLGQKKYLPEGFVEAAAAVDEPAANARRRLAGSKNSRSASS